MTDYADAQRVQRQIQAVAGTSTPDEAPRNVRSGISLIKSRDRAGRNTASAPAASTRASAKPPALRRRLILADIAALIIGIAIAFGVQAVIRPVSASVASGHLLLVIASLPGFAIGAGANKLYRARANEGRLEEAGNVLKAIGVGVSSMLIISLGVQYDGLSRLWLAALASSTTVAVLTERRIARSMFQRLRQHGQLRRRIIIVGTDSHAISLSRTYADNPALGYEVAGFAGNDDDGRQDIDVLGPIDALSDLLERQDAVGVVVSLASVASDEVNVLTRRLTDDGYHVALSSSLHDIDVTRLRPQSLDGRTMIYVEPVVRSGWHAMAKRAFDMSLALAILLATIPLQLVVGLAIALTSKGPVFFRQIRVGKDGELFQVLKFRTMYHDAEERKAALMDRNEADGPLFKMKHDPRITPLGRILRKLSIDELPQLLCVLIGSMSMVGPRPALPSEVEQWDDDVRKRLRVLPGLTGLWQVSGRSDSSFETYKRMDLYYVDNWSLIHDVKICLRTIVVVLSGSGAS